MLGTEMDEMEIELKLKVDASDLKRLRKHPVLARLGAEALTTEDLETTYYDTPKFNLLAERTSVRVRHDGKGRVLNIKHAGHAGGALTVRREREYPLKGKKLDLSVIKDPDLKDLLSGKVARKLTPVFATRFKRATTRLHPDGAEILVCLDQGEITAGKLTQPIAEIELEVQRGGAGAAFDIALELSKTVPLRIELISKADRGYALAGGVGERVATKASPVGLQHGMSVEQAFRHVVRGCIGHLLANEPCLLDDTDPVEGIHQMRVSMRRLRAAFSLFRPVLDSDVGQALSAEARWLARQLGDARDWDVFLSDILKPVLKAQPDDAKALKALRAVARDRRMGARDRALTAVASPRYTKLLLTLGSWTEAHGWRHENDADQAAHLAMPVEELAAGLLTKRYKKLVKLGKRFDDLSTPELHELRIRGKKLRYAGDFFRGLYDPGRAAPFLSCLGDMQDSLGALQDQVVADGLMAELGHDPLVAAGRDLVSRYYAEHAAGAREAARGDWTGFYDLSPFWR